MVAVRVTEDGEVDPRCTELEERGVDARGVGLAGVGDHEGLANADHHGVALTDVDVLDFSEGAGRAATCAGAPAVASLDPGLVTQEAFFHKRFVGDR